jgi:hypothetical protein
MTAASSPPMRIGVSAAAEPAGQGDEPCRAGDGNDDQPEGCCQVTAVLICVTTGAETAAGPP